MKCCYRLFLWQLYYAYAIADRPQQQRMLTEPLPALWDWIMPFAVEMKGDPLPMTAVTSCVMSFLVCKNFAKNLQCACTSQANWDMT